MKQADLDLISQLVDSTTDAGSITIGATAVKIMEINRQRKLALITNDSASDIYLGFGNSVTTHSGIRLNALGGSFEFGAFSTFPWMGEIWAIAAGAGNTLTFVEA